MAVNTSRLSQGFIQKKEDVAFFFYSLDNPEPVHLEAVGITHPNPNYKMSRRNSQYVIFEFITTGKGWLRVDDKSWDVKGGISIF